MYIQEQQVIKMIALCSAVLVYGPLLMLPTISAVGRLQGVGGAPWTLHVETSKAPE